ncbi:hypothetical protein [Flavobacterium aestivum]|uniref:hypothetical protein n=1 Tax=Flavobacterium aestivum TaxID=3003257 RepID=UPI002285D672|nr:hypothetical protein [Flavobacterium aestivum]
MELNSKKLELIKRILETNDIDLLEKIKAIFEEKENEIWEELTPEQQEEINIAIQNENRGDVVDF